MFASFGLRVKTERGYGPLNPLSPTSEPPDPTVASGLAIPSPTATGSADAHLAEEHVAAAAAGPRPLHISLSVAGIDMRTPSSPATRGGRPVHSVHHLS